MYQKFKKEIESAIKIRVLESELLNLFSKGLLNGTVHTCVGQEMIGVMVSKYLVKDDFVVSNHRGHGHYLARTGDYKGLLAEIMGRSSGCSGGVGGSQHLVNDNYLSNGIQGGMAPIAAGVALSNKVNKINSISVVYIGDGTLGQGVLYETFNICANWDLPVVFVLEDNKYAQSTSSRQTFSGSKKFRAEGFGLEYFNVCSNNIEDLDEITNKAISFARDKKKPVLLHIDTYRLNSHSKGDDNRSFEEVDVNKQKDLLNHIKTLTPDYFQEYYKKSQKEIDIIIDEVLLEPKLSSSSFLMDIPYLVSIKSKLIELEGKQKNKKRINEEVHDGIRAVFESDSSFLLGEDIEYTNQYTKIPYGGAFKVSNNLSIDYPDRVKNTPISEQAITGIATGLALKGNKSIVEIMFGDFTTLIVDQLQQHASKFKKMYADKVHCPVIVRTPMGGGRGYGPTHSQSLESLFYSILGLRIVALNKYSSSRDLLINICKESKEPTLLIENKTLYTQKRCDHQEIFGYLIENTDDSFPQTLIRPIEQSPHITLMCYGGTATMVKDVLEILAQNDFFVEVIIPTSLKPFNTYQLEMSLERTGKMLTIEEGNKFGGILGSISLNMHEQGLKFGYSSLSTQSILSCAIDAEMDALPSVNAIVEKCLEVLK